MQITAAMVKELRDITGAGMMECKKALAEVGGDTDSAIEWMRKHGLAKAEKKAGRIAADGVISIVVNEQSNAGCLIEINCETDFVARGDDFIGFVKKVSSLVMAKAPADVNALSAMPLAGDKSVEQVRQELVSKIGENIQVRRFVRLESNGYIGSYSHGGRIGVLVDLDKADQSLAKDIAMHIAASRPVCISEKDMPADHLEKEKDILIAQASESKKPADIIEKMVEGRIKKYLADVTLLGQPFVKDPDQSVGKLLKSASANVNAFVRFEVGEGIEKKQEDFAEEVMAQVKAG